MQKLFFFLRFRLKQEGIWGDVDLQSSSILEIHFPVDALVIKPIISETSNLAEYTVKSELTINCTPESTSQLLALAVDHVDILLEDWYPTLGTRFVHTSEGKFLVTRLVPCPQCLQSSPESDQFFANTPTDFPSSKNFFDGMQQNDGDADLRNRTRKSQESYTSECDSGVGPDSTGSSRMPSMEGHPLVQVDENTNNNQIYYSWMVEECILASYGSRNVNCPAHGDINLARLAPDTVSLLLGLKNVTFFKLFKKCYHVMV